MKCSLLLPKVFLVFILFALGRADAADGPGRWPVEKANAWLAEHGWLRGGNFTPSTAINQLEMWQAETFDEATIDRELGYAESLGLNSMRVFLHDLPWQQDRVGYTQRVERFLALAEKHKIGILFAIFDSCWYPLPKLGKQPEPLPHVHNSGWVQSPGAAVLQDPKAEPALHDYVTGFIKHFANDKRIVGWDVWNEPENGDGGAVKRPGLEPKNKADLVLAMLPKVFAWAREANPSQPLTSGVWGGDWSSDDKLTPMRRVQLENSDVISFHNYGKLDELRQCVQQLKRFGRPILCTEYMARPNGSTFKPLLGFMKEQNVAAYCWGFVAGKTQTNYPWDSWTKTYTAEPPLWFHDILRADGTPYRTEEADYIRKITRKGSGEFDVALTEVSWTDMRGNRVTAGTYRNPVLRGDYPDPSVIRVGEDYYATSTSSEWGPQFPILHSKDLVNWEIVGSVFPKRPDWATENFWAPEIQQWKGKFYIYYVGRKKGQPLAVAVATASRPEGPWTDHGPLVSQDAGSIDGMAIDDEKGQRWLVWKEDGNSRQKPTPIWAQQLDADGTKLIGEMHEILRNDAPWEGPLIEGPYILRRGDWFYMIYAGNACCGRGCNYATGVARSKTLLGPWETNPRNPIMDRNADFRGPGHGSIVADAKGRYWFLYHAYDVASFIFTGREMMLDEVTFGDDGWPVINGGKGPSASAPSPTGAVQTRAELTFFDDFTEGKLRPGWQWPVGSPVEPRFQTAGNAALVLAPSGTAGPLGEVLARSAITGDYTATTTIEGGSLLPGVRASLSAFGDPANALGLAIQNDAAIVWRVEKGQRRELARIERSFTKAVHVRMTASGGKSFHFSVSDDGTDWKPVGEAVDGDYLPPWDRSVRVALIANGGEARFASLRIEATK